MTIERDPNYYRGWGEGAIDEVRFVDHQRRGDGALDGRVGRTDDDEPVPIARHLRRALEDAALQDRQGRDLDRLLSEVQHQGRSRPTTSISARRSRSPPITTRSSATILPGGDLTGPLPKTFAEPPSRRSPRRSSTSRPRRPKSPRAPMPARRTFRITLTLCLRRQIRGRARAADAGQSQQIGFKVTPAGEPWNRVTEIASKVDDHAEYHRSLLRPTYPSPDSMFYAQYRFASRRAPGPRWNGCRTPTSTS